MQYLPYFISVTVTLLSAMLVDKIIFLLDLGGLMKTDCCSSDVIDECSGFTQYDSYSSEVL